MNKKHYWLFSLVDSEKMLLYKTAEGNISYKYAINKIIEKLKNNSDMKAG
jgi:hypothetical protein